MNEQCKTSPMSAAEKCIKYREKKKAEERAKTIRVNETPIIEKNAQNNTVQSVRLSQQPATSNATTESNKKRKRSPISAAEKCRRYREKNKEKERAKNNTLNEIRTIEEIAQNSTEQTAKQSSRLQANGVSISNRAFKFEPTCVVIRPDCNFIISNVHQDGEEDDGHTALPSYANMPIISNVQSNVEFVADKETNASTHSSDIPVISSAEEDCTTIDQTQVLITALKERDKRILSLENNLVALKQKLQKQQLRQGSQTDVQALEKRDNTIISLRNALAAKSKQNIALLDQIRKLENIGMNKNIKINTLSKSLGRKNGCILNLKKVFSQLPQRERPSILENTSAIIKLHPKTY